MSVNMIEERVNDSAMRLAAPQGTYVSNQVQAFLGLIFLGLAKSDLHQRVLTKEKAIIEGASNSIEG